MNKTEVAIKKVHNSLLWAIFMRHFTALCTLWFFVWGSVVLVARVLNILPAHHLIYGIPGIVISALIAILKGRRSAPADPVLRAKLDAINRDGGILMASAETNLQEWNEQVVISTIPSATWRDPRAIGLLGLAIIFLLAAFLVPLPDIHQQHSKSMAINELTENLKEQIQLVEDEELADKAQTRELKDALDNIEKDASGETPLKTWEAIDNVMNSLENIAEKASSDLSSTIEDASELQALAENLNNAATNSNSKTGPEELTQAAAELANLMTARNMLNKLDGASIPPDLANAIREASLTPAQLQQLAKALSKCKSGSLKKLGKLCKAGLVDPATLSKCRSIAKDKQAALAAFLAKEGANTECLTSCCCPIPGKGAPNRGRGDAPMTWTDGSDENNAAFKDQIIEPDAIGAINNSQLVGLSKVAPEANAKPIDARGGAISPAASGRGGARKQPVLPQHKQAVIRYFHRGDTNNDN